MERKALSSPGTCSTWILPLAEPRCPDQRPAKQRPTSAAPEGRETLTTGTGNQRGVNWASKSEMLELNTKRFLGKFAAF